MTNVACVSLAIGYPTLASVPHSIANGFKNLLAIAAETDISFKEAETMKELLSDPEKLAALTAAAAAAAPAAGGAAEEKKEEAKKVCVRVELWLMMKFATCLMLRCWRQAIR